MPSTVGLQKKEVDVLTQAVKLELDCVAAYTEAANAVKDKGTADTFAHMARDCRRHVNAWQGRLQALDRPGQVTNNVSAGLNRFKVKVARLLGTRAIGQAVKNNSKDSATAYHRVAKRADLSAATRALANGFLPDAAKHLQWVEALLRQGHTASAH